MLEMGLCRLQKMIVRCLNNGTYTHILSGDPLLNYFNLLYHIFCNVIRLATASEFQPWSIETKIAIVK